MDISKAIRYLESFTPINVSHFKYSALRMLKGICAGHDCHGCIHNGMTCAISDAVESVTPESIDETRLKIIGMLRRLREVRHGNA